MTVKDLMGSAIQADLEVVKVDHENQLFVLTDGQSNFALSFRHAEESEDKIKVNKQGTKTYLSCESWRRASNTSKWLRTDKSSGRLDINAILEGL